MPIEDVSFSDVSISMSQDAQAGAPDMADDIEPMSRAGFIAHNVRGLRLRGVNVEGQAGKAFVMENVTEDGGPMTADGGRGKG